MISILLAAVAAGLAAGLLRAGIAGRPFSPPELGGSWLALAGFLLQIAALYIRLPFEPLGERISAAALAGSLLLLLAFAWRNRQDAAFYWLGGGLLLNLAVMALNGGWMPISPETLAQVYPDLPAGAVELGSRVGTSKNVALAAADTRLEWLADRFLLPDRLPFQIAYSAGDVLIAIGAFWLLWHCGGPHRRDAAVAASA